DVACLVACAQDFRGDGAAALAWARLRYACLGEPQSLGIHPVARRNCRDLPFQGRHDPDARRLLRRWHPALSRGAVRAMNPVAKKRSREMTTELDRRSFVQAGSALTAGAV